MIAVDVEAKTLAEIDALRVGDLAPGLVATALELARQLDECEAPTSAAVVARELRATLLELRKVAPPAAAAADPLDQLAEKRKRRRGA
ncbi:hypothetical protein [Streptomyces sp. NRRL F-5650]|uniref:hypothetical protein n=1 Tax=Streptomyces sp. NRRL F-5650 TaxID=1463868 RepID=UPI000B1EF0B2|nr:hypothetical protein [Streptomyces sp. NRRL F-5650]